MILISFLKMSSSVCDEELLSSSASLSPCLSLGALEIPHYSDPIIIEVITTPEPTIEIKPSSYKTPIVNTQPTSSTLKTRHVSTPPTNNLHNTIDKATNTVPTKKQYNILENPVFIDSGILPPALKPVKTLLNPILSPLKSLALTQILKLISLLFI